ncbi:MAG TPA: hypothetical protein PKJ99_01935 [Thermoanaerobaculales bacterium]|nr:hypothetical protein [Thermoanaerobaculales bacterium]HQL29425.1 hypothetical protein [Thermoanaerobaculales bacterium]HQN95543.1 hypothetical protein [Thermoanaerobaculales bacterium]
MIIALAAGFAVAVAPVAAQGCPELIGRWPYGPTAAVAASADLAYLGSGSTLQIADVSDPSTPRVVGDVELPWLVLGISASGGYVYVAAGDGLRVIDARVPAAPVQVGFIATQGLAIDVAVAGNFAYLADGSAGLRVIDVASPTTPVEVASVDTPNLAIDVALAGGYAYVADVGTGLHVIDVGVPAASHQVGHLDTPGVAYGVAVANSYVFVAAEAAGLRVIDAATVDEPVEVGFIDTPGLAYGVAVAGGFAYVADDTEGLRVVDVSVPSSPVEAGAADTPGYAYGVAVADDLAYIADWGGGLRVIDVSLPPAPTEMSFVDVPGSAASIDVSGGNAFVGFSPAGLRSFDLSDPAAPAEVGFVGTPAAVADVAASGGFAYAADGEGGLRVISVLDPSAPVEVGFVDTPGSASGVAVSGTHAYVADGDAGLRVIDVSAPSAPVEVGSIGTPGTAQGVVILGTHAYVAGGDAGLRVIDVSTPAAPVEVGSVDTPGFAWDVALAGRHAYVADDAGGLWVVDVGTPSAPVPVGSLGAAGQISRAVAVAGGYAYLADYAPSGLRVVDVRTPSAPVEVGFFETPAPVESVVVSAGRVYAAGSDTGVYVFSECAGGPSPDRESFIPAAAVAAGAQGAFFSTDVEVNNTGTEAAQLTFQWLPRGEDNSDPISSDVIALAPGQSQRYENVLAELFGLGADSLGALRLVANTESVIGMSRTYNIPAGKTAGTFGQGLPAIRATEMIAGTEPQRIIFLSEDPDFRANVGCVNGSSEPVTINIGIFDAEGSPLETKTMDLGPWSNNQINRVFRDYQPVNGYVDVWAGSDVALYYCYGSMLDNITSDPTTILPQVPSDDTTFIPAAALAAGLEGAFFETDVDLNNVGSTDLTYELLWLPRGADNGDPVRSDTFSLAPGAGVRYANVLDEVFGLEPDQAGALAIEASGPELLAMSRTYNLPWAKVAGTFGQELPGIPEDRMIASGVKKRIIFMNENDDVRSNVGCQNGSGQTVRVFIELFNSEGESLETKTMDLAPYSNNQITRVFRNHSPIEAGYVDIWTNTEGASIFGYGSVLDNTTSDPTTVLPQ